MNLHDLLINEISQQELLNYYNANVKYEYLPSKINGFVFCYKGIYNITINKCLSYYKRKKAIIHEIAHIELNQLCQYNKDMFAFYRDKYEDDADKYLKEIIGGI